MFSYSTYGWFVCFVFLVYFLVCFELSVPMQVFAWKDLSPNYPFCVERDIKLRITHSYYVMTFSYNNVLQLLYLSAFSRPTFWDRNCLQAN